MTAPGGLGGIVLSKAVPTFDDEILIPVFGHKTILSDSFSPFNDAAKSGLSCLFPLTWVYFHPLSPWEDALFDKTRKSVQQEGERSTRNSKFSEDMKMSTPSLLGLSLPALEELLRPLGLKAFQVRQIYRWMYNARRLQPREMTNISKTLRETLERAIPGSLCPGEDGLSQDGSEKMLFRLRRSQGGDRVHPGEGTQDLLPLHTGGVQIPMPLLPHRRHGVQEKPDRSGDRLSTPLRPEQVLPSPRRGSTSSSWGWESSGEPPALKEALPVITDPEGSRSPQGGSPFHPGNRRQARGVHPPLPGGQGRPLLHFPTPEGRLLYMPAQRVHR